MNHVDRRILAALAVALFLWFVWPTPYAQLAQSRPPGWGMKYNRFTGAVCYHGQSCWRD